MTPRHWLLLLVTAALFGSSFFFIKIAVADLPPMTIAAGRAMIAAMAIGAVARGMGVTLPPPGRGWIPLIVVGILTAIIPYSAIATGQTLIDSSLGGILFASIPLFSLLISRLVPPGEALTAGRIAGAGIGLAGVATVIGPQALAGLSNQIAGAGLTLLAAASYAGGAVYSRTQPQVSPLVMATGQVVVAAPVLMLVAALSDTPWQAAPSTTALAAIIAVGLFSTAAPVVLFFRLVSEIGPTRTSIMTFFMPVFAVLLGTALLGETLSTAAYAGFALIIAGAVLISRAAAKPAKAGT